MLLLDRCRGKLHQTAITRAAGFSALNAVAAEPWEDTSRALCEAATCGGREGGEISAFRGRASITLTPQWALARGPAGSGGAWHASRGASQTHRLSTERKRGVGVWKGKGEALSRPMQTGKLPVHTGAAFVRETGMIRGETGGHYRGTRNL